MKLWKMAKCLLICADTSARWYIPHQIQKSTYTFDRCHLRCTLSGLNYSAYLCLLDSLCTSLSITFSFLILKTSDLDSFTAHTHTIITKLYRGACTIIKLIHIVARGYLKMTEVALFHAFVL